MRLFLPLLLALLLIAGGTYYQFYYPPMVKKHATEHALQHFADAVATKDRAKIGEALQQWLTDTAHIRLEIGFFSLAQPEGGKPATEDFDKPTFITFIDNILYSLSDYDYRAQLHDFSLSADGKIASVAFASQAWGDGMSYYGGTGINMRFSSDSACEGEVAFDGEKPRLDKVTCKMQLRSVPKPGEAEKLQNPETLREFLR